MKKLSTIAIILIACFTFSCQKEDDSAKPTTSTGQQSPKAGLPHFDEKNTTSFSWDSLPDELKNATPLKSGSEKERVASSSYSYSLGPWGGSGGSPFYIFPPAGSKIYAIAIRSGVYVDRLTIWYKRADGSIYVGGDVGGSGGGYYLQYFSDYEYIYYVAGRSGAYLDRLTIYTNYKSFSYGGNGGSPFWASVPSGYQFLGFYGGSGALVDRIGFYVYSR